MSADGSPAVEAGRPRAKSFRRSVRKPALSPDQKRRQAAVTDAAWRFFGTGPRMIAFLNADHPELGGRPLDVALDSDPGLDAVLGLLRAPEQQA